MRSGLAAVCLLAVVLAFVAGGRKPAAAAHTCSATDRQFIQTAGVNLTALGAWGEEYLNGGTDAREVVVQAREAAARVSGTAPRDPTLRRTRTLMNAMFVEYGRAVQARARRGNPGVHMYRAYRLANFAHRLLAEAKPELDSRGCDLSGLL